LGYFVDIYDLILFSIVRVPSLKSLGLEGEELFARGVLLLNMQMIGMLLGGIAWGVLGDKRGRLSVLFGSIFLYSSANLANAWVQSVEAYAALRFIAGLGLAGELGAGITLVAEILPKHSRGFGTTMVAAFGILGALLAGTVAEHTDWRTAYIVGGVLGLALLLLRVSVLESGLFVRLKDSAHRRGDFLYLFRDGRRFFKYLCCILIGVPVWYVIGVLMTFSPEFAAALGIVDPGTGPVSAGRAVMWAYGGLSLGDLASGLLSQAWGSRKKVLAVFLAITAAFVAIYLHAFQLDLVRFYWLCGALGFGVGFWAIFVTVAAEQFGTNLRATVTTTVPNFVRGSVVPLTMSFAYLKGTGGVLYAATVIGVVVLAISVLSLWRLDETFGKDLDYLETL
jgi:MFS family permease